MNLKITDENLNQVILSYSGRSTRYRQVASRLRKLLPDQLSKLIREHRRNMTPGKANRVALADQRYESFINEVTETSSTALEARIIWETHNMLIDARRSMRAFHRR